MLHQLQPDDPAHAASASARLRQQAESQLHALAEPAGEPLTSQATQALLHELQVHQIELETQNQRRAGYLTRTLRGLVRPGPRGLPQRG